MDVYALILSGLALLVSVVGTLLSDRRAQASNDLATRALEETHKASERALWSDAIEAVHRVLIDPTTEPIGDRLQTMRVRLIALVDGLPDWIGLDAWLAAEHGLGIAFGRQVMDRHRDDMSVDAHLALLAPFQDWGVTLAQNLRHLRNVGYSPEDITGLRHNTAEVLARVYAANNWGPLPGHIGLTDDSTPPE